MKNLHGRHIACLRGHRTPGTPTSVGVSVRSPGLPSQAVSGTVSIGPVASLADRGSFMSEEPARAPRRLPSWSPNAWNSRQCQYQCQKCWPAKSRSVWHRVDWPCSKSCRPWFMPEHLRACVKTVSVSEVLACQIKPCLAQC